MIMQIINPPIRAQYVQVLIEGTAVAKRRRTDGVREFLLHWYGAGGELHEVWIEESRVKLISKEEI